MSSRVKSGHLLMGSGPVLDGNQPGACKGGKEGRSAPGGTFLAIREGGIPSIDNQKNRTVNATKCFRSEKFGD